MQNWAKGHRLTLFVVLTFLLSWYPSVIALFRGTTTGPNPLGPFLAALIVAAISSGKGSVKDLLAKVVRWRVSPGYYLVALGLPVLLCALAAALTVSVGHGTMNLVPLPWQEVLERFIVIFLFIGLGEEPGWRGFALPELQRRFSPVAATLMLAGVWALWHLPLIGNEFPLPIVPQFLASLLGGAFVQTWLFNRSRESVFLQMLFHASVNTIGAGVVFRWFSGPDIAILWWSNAALWLAAGTASFLVPSRATPNQPEESVETAGA